MNTKLLLEVQKHILEEPRRLVMSRLAVKKGEVCSAPDMPKSFAKCGTAACIAGWILILSGNKPFTETEDGNGSETAERLLRLPTDSADRLFHVFMWPERFKHEYNSAKTPAKRASVAANRIDHFIKTKGAE